MALSPKQRLGCLATKLEILSRDLKSREDTVLNQKVDKEFGRQPVCSACIERNIRTFLEQAIDECECSSFEDDIIISVENPVLDWYATDKETVNQLVIGEKRIYIQVPKEVYDLIKNPIRTYFFSIVPGV